MPYRFIFLLAAMLGFSLAVRAQDEYEDSLQKSILQSVQKKFDEHNVSKIYLDSSKFSHLALPELKQIFENVNKEISAAQSVGDIDGLGKAYHKLSTMDSMKGNYKSAFENYKLYAAYQDSLRKKELEKKDLQMRLQREFDKKQGEQQLEKAKEDRRNAMRMIFLVAILLVLISISVSSFIAYKREQKAKKTVAAQNTALETTLSDLKATQLQLVHSEKMASLGELTAGIAHEIRNPLNFVNNFSEVNKEMIVELKTEIENGNYKEVKVLADDIEVNQEKIAHHCKRADAIVKDMLQHARQGNGEKQSTDVNSLVNEYLRLSYQAVRSKNTSFQANIKTSFDEMIGNINLVPQDIGRVLLNLYNNAFYAVNEKKMGQEEDFEPTVTVRTKRLPGKVEIQVKDNGSGIAQKNIDKIFQPFFTTKPTGEGTGLGLSLSYDIITKGHGGTLQVKAKEGEGSDFLITLPASGN